MKHQLALLTALLLAPLTSLTAADAAESKKPNIVIFIADDLSWHQKGEAGDAFARSQAARYTRRPAVELYDLQTDPWELNNLVGKPEHADVVARLRTQLDAWMQQQGDEGDKTEREAKEHQGGVRAGKKAKNQ